jgi:uncharacterized protein (DUF697 family)
VKNQVSAEPPVADDDPVPNVTHEERARRAEKLIDRFTLWSGAAGLIPIPVVDAAVFAGAQFQMLRRLAQIYDVKFSDNLGKSVLASLTGSLIPVTSGIGVASALKGIPVIGTAAAVATMPALAGGATYVIGRVFMRHFESGGTLLDFNPPDYREFIKEQADKLKAKLDAPPAQKSGTPN